MVRWRAIMRLALVVVVVVMAAGSAAAETEPYPWPDDPTCRDHCYFQCSGLAPHWSWRACLELCSNTIC